MPALQTKLSDSAGRCKLLGDGGETPDMLGYKSREIDLRGNTLLGTTGNPVNNVAW